MTVEPFMTALMRRRGINVTGSDRADPGLSGYRFGVAEHDPGQVRAEAKTMVRRHPAATIFCSWPSYRETWFHQALKAMRIGQRMVVIREGACANDEAWGYLDGKCFTEEKVIDVPVFDCMHDYAGVYLKKRQRP